GIPIADYCTHCVGFEDYQAVAAEVLAQEAGWPEPERIAMNGHTIEAPSDDPLSLAGPAVTSEGVMFTLEASDAESVQLAGDFNGWALNGSEMELTDGIWKKVVKLPPGRYRYRYVIDGRWQSDPLNAVVEPSAYGGDDSILVVDEEVAT